MLLSTTGQDVFVKQNKEERVPLEACGGVSWFLKAFYSFVGVLPVVLPFVLFSRRAQNFEEATHANIEAFHVIVEAFHDIFAGVP